MASRPLVGWVVCFYPKTLMVTRLIREVAHLSRLLCIVGACAVSVLTVSSPAVVAQEVSFTPRYDGIDEGQRRKSATPTPVVVTKTQPVYSFARFNGLFKALCAGLEIEGRRARVFEVAKVGLAEEGDCSSCRALYRQLIQSCGTPAKPTQKPKTQKKSPKDADVDGNDEGLKAPEPISPPAPPARYPGTELLDVVSRLSAELYDLEPGAGSTFRAVKSFEERLLKSKDLTPGERDYCSVLTTYLLASWDGRPDSPLGSRTLSREDIADLFQ